MTASPQTLTRLMREMRTGFNQMKALAEALGSDLGITPSLRAVLEGLNDGKGHTVPSLARERGVSRQHIQTIMNGLLDRGLVHATENPGHRRSPLYELTEEGVAMNISLRAREAAPLASLAASLPAAETESATDLLARFNRALATELAARDTPDKADSDTTA